MIPLHERQLGRALAESAEKYSEGELVTHVVMFTCVGVV